MRQGAVIAGRERPDTGSRDRWVMVAGIGGIVVVVAFIAAGLNAANLDAWLGVLTFLVLVAVGVPILRWVAVKCEDPGLYPLLVAGFLMKLVFSMIRYFVLEVVYSGEGDGGIYHATGVIWAQRFLDGVAIHPIHWMQGFPQESQRIGDLTGVLYLFSGPSYYSGFLMFAAIGFIGQVFMLRALRVAVPEADHRRYDLLVLFLPSLLFWPSSIGKEAVMIGCLGVLSYGGALLLAPRPQARGALIFLAGLVAVLLIRPHVALMAVGSLVVATGVGVLGGFGGGGGKTGKGRVIRLTALIILLVAAGVASTRASSMFKEDSGDAAGAGSALEETLAQTSRGGSEFTPLTATSPVELPGAILSVLFRPLPWEARSINSLIAGAETVLLLGLLVASWRRVASFPKLAMRRPYLVYATGFVVAFSVGFSFVGNFGILARQRTQMLPMVLILLALPPIKRAANVVSHRQPFGAVGDSEDHSVTVAPAANATVQSNSSLLGSDPSVP